VILRDLLLAPSLPPGAAAALLAPYGFRDARRADDLLQRLAGASAEERRALADALPAILEELRSAGSPERGLANLVRLAEQSASRLTLFRELSADRAALERAAILLSQSQYFADVLVREPRLLSWLAQAAEPPAREALSSEIERTLTALEDEDRRHAALERLKRRELLGVGYRDHVLGRPLAAVAREIATLAEVIVEAALGLARRKLATRFPGLAAAGASGFAVLALGKLGGAELNYSSDVDLVFVHDERFATGAEGVTPREVFDRVARELVRILTRAGPEGALYRVDLRLRPEGAHGALSRSIPAFVAYYEQYGRTWERQALLKARPIAGDLALGGRLVEAVQPFVYRRYLDVAAIAEIKALKRRVETRGAAQPTRDVKEGPGGIRDIEFATQFLQLLYGADLPEVREPSTLGAIARLEAAGCLAAEEAATMREAYVFLRKVEHRLQTLQGFQTHVLPADEEGAADLASRSGYRGEGALARFRADLERHGAGARRTLDRLLHGLFPEAGEKDALAAAPELILDADPPAEKVARILGACGFSDPPRALADLRRLATETSRFLAPSPRTRTYLASLLPRLLRAIGETADPQATLSRFERAAAMLGGKAVFYQLLAEQPAGGGTAPIEVFVRLAADSPLLTGELSRTPGLFDEVVDLLLTGARVTRAEVSARAAALRAAGTPPLEALAAVKRSSLLLVGIRDLGGRANVANVQAELTALAEAILDDLVRIARAEVEEKLGPAPGARFAVLGLGKLGGREIGYGSDLDLVFAYDGPDAAERAQRTARAILRLSQQAQLYEMDARLRPEGAHGAIAQSFDALERYYRDGRAAAWERLAAMKLRAVAGDAQAAEALGRRVVAAALAGPQEGLAREVRAMRARLEQAAAGPRDLKRSPGGLVDIEFAVAYAKLAARGAPPEILEPGVVPALHALVRAGLASREAHTDLLTAYQFYRTVEARLRIVDGRPVSVLPAETAALRALALRLGYVDTRRKRAEEALLAEHDYHARKVRARFLEMVPG
jgi:glutamate-ammonia-ligase adenylyltransferase